MVRGGGNLAARLNRRKALARELARKENQPIKRGVAVRIFMPHGNEHLDGRTGVVLRVLPAR